MTTVEYSLGCRQCMNSDGTPHSTIDMNADQTFYLKKSEYQLMIELEESRKESKTNCAFCKSQNVEVYDISVNGNKSFVPSTIIDTNEFILVIKLEKKNGQVEIGNKGSNYRDGFAAIFALDKLIETILERDTDLFVQKDAGFFSALISGKPDASNKQGDYVCKIERLRHAGFDQDEILDILNPLKYKL